MDLRVTFHWKTAVRRTWRVLSECILTAVPSLKMKSEGVSTLLLKILDGILLFLLFCDAGEVYLHSSTKSNYTALKFTIFVKYWCSLVTCISWTDDAMVMKRAPNQNDTLPMLFLMISSSMGTHHLILELWHFETDCVCKIWTLAKWSHPHILNKDDGDKKM